MSSQQVVFQYLSAGSNTLTVPAGFSNQVLVYAWGAGGGAGYNGPAGGGGGFVQGIVTVSSGDTVVISVGGQGGVGPRDGSGIGGIGDTPAISFNGGTTGVAAPYPGNDDQYYGAGGGGGAATAVLVNGVPMIVAAGGGGGGGGTSYQTGSPGSAGGVTTLASTTPRGGTSPDGYAVGGAGGAGYPFGGAGGTTAGDDAGGGGGGYGGQNYANVNVASTTLSAGSGVTPGGLTNALYPKAKRGYNGYDGAVIVIFTKSFRAWIKDTTWKEANNAWVKADNAWKQITRAWVKADDEWKPIQSGVSLVPIPSTAEVVTINLTIAANANNYVLSDFLSATSYYPGRSIVNLTVNAGVIVGSGTVGTPALIVDGLVSGDLINLTNNGNIAGAGGQGGAAGSYVVTSGGACFPVNTLVSTPQGQIAIQDIQIGDIVYSYKVTEELNYAVELVEKIVIATAKHSWEDYNQTSPLLVITHEHGKLIVTKNHELLNNAVQNPLSDLGFARADELSIGDSLVLIDGVLTKILDIQPGEQYDFVYNLEVDDFHTYIAGGIRVHNGTQNSAKQTNSKGYQNFGYSTKGYASSTSGTTTSVPGRPGELGGPALYVTYQTNLVNNGTIAGGGGGGGGGGGPTGGQGGGGAGRKAGSGANNGTLTAGAAGAGLGAAGGARGSAGSAGTNDTNAGGIGGAPGAAIIGVDKIIISTEGTILGTQIV